MNNYRSNDKRMDSVLDNIKIFGNKKSNYVPFNGGGCYPLWSQDFVRTGFTDIMFTLSARDYKDPKCVIVKQKR